MMKRTILTRSIIVPSIQACLLSLLIMYRDIHIMEKGWGDNKHDILFKRLIQHIYSGHSTVIGIFWRALFKQQYPLGGM